jgi:hypothetical protein
MADMIIPADPTLAAFHDTPERVEQRFMVYYAQTLTPTGEAHTVRVERPALREEAPLQVEVIQEQDDE